jgi:hypothetical protein
MPCLRVHHVLNKYYELVTVINLGIAMHVVNTCFPAKVVKLNYRVAAFAILFTARRLIRNLLTSWVHIEIKIGREPI